jgi:hypothetical protein
MMPATPSILQPTEDDTLPLHDSVYCEWDSAADASFYYIGYSGPAYDSLGELVGFCSTEEMFTKSTSLTIPTSHFNVPGAAWYAVSVRVQPYNGAFPEPGELTNMSGDMIGFLIAEGPRAYVRFFVGTPTGKGKHRTEEPIIGEPMDLYIKMMGLQE